ncbi:hypothetical protein ACHQM5_025157 [Ranunculus cassubicifolius]
MKSTPRRNIRLVKANYIKEFAVLKQGEDPLDPKECFIDLKALQAREESAIRQAEMEAERIGVGVTAEVLMHRTYLMHCLRRKWFWYPYCLISVG